MKRIALILLMVFVAIYPILAQSEVPTEEVAETQAATQEAAQTFEPVPVTVVPTQVALDPTATPETGQQESEQSNSTDIVNLGTIALLIVLTVFGIADRVTNYRLSKEAMSQIPPQYLPLVQHGVEVAQKQFYERAGAVATGTPFVWDENLLKEEMNRTGWEFYTDPSTGQQLARKKPQETPPAIPPATN